MGSNLSKPNSCETDSKAFSAKLFGKDELRSDNDEMKKDNGEDNVDVGSGTSGKRFSTLAETSAVRRTLENIQKFSEQDMKRELNEIYERSKTTLNSLVVNPCTQLEQKISECLKNNPLQVNDCLATVNKYQKYVKEKTSEIFKGGKGEE